MLRSKEPVRFVVRSILFASLLLVGRAACGQYFPPGDSRAGGMHDLMLIYLGQDSRSKEDFLPYVAYLGKEETKKPLDWFYDSFLFLAYGGAPSKTTYIDGPTLKTDWEHYFDKLLFCKNRSLDSLEACIVDVEMVLGPREKKTPIILMIPYPSAKQRDFGDVDGDGRSEDLSRPEDRIKATRWCVDQLLTRWKKAGFSRLTLWGFYWMNEGIPAADEAVVRATADYIHQQGYGLHWIPYFRAKGIEKCAELGIDFAVLQPNYAFMGRSGLHPNPQRLTETAQLARQYHLGIEIEMVEHITSRTERENLRDYLIHGGDDIDGYMRQAVHAYYASEKSIPRLCYSDLPADRQLYEALYLFAKKTYAGKRQTPSQQASYRILGKTVPEFPDDGKKLVDGLRAPNPAASDRVVGLEGEKAQIELDLGDVRRVAGVELRGLMPGSASVASETQGRETGRLPSEVQTKLFARCQRPRSVELAASLDGKTWRTVGTGYRWYASPLSPDTTLAVDTPPLDARRLLVTLHGVPGKVVLLDEVELRTADTLTEQARYTLSPLPAQADPTGCLLTDTIYASGPADPDRSLRWKTGEEVTVQLDLHDVRHVGLVRLHTPAGADTIQRVGVWARSCQPGHASPWHELGSAERSRNHFTLDAAAQLTSELRLVITPKPEQAVVLDEIEVYPAQNLALGKPYEFTPELPEQYGDPGRRKLTDGEVSERGFGDRRTVGWFFRETELTLDLEHSCPINAVRVHVQGGGYAAVEFPSRIDVLASPDGRLWHWVDSIDETPGQLLFDQTHEGTRLQLGWMKGAFKPVEARFVRLQFTPKGWLMPSEIEVLSHGKNVALGRSYGLRPAPTSAAPYGDASGLLTDGVLTTSGFGQHRAVGWNEGRPTITLDLLAPTPVAKVAARVLGGGLGGVHFPKRMTVLTSRDGVHWSTPSIAEEHPPETKDQSLKTYMVVELLPQECRYVQLQFDRHGWLMLDEIEVFEPKPAKTSSRTDAK